MTEISIIQRRKICLGETACVHALNFIDTSIINILVNPTICPRDIKDPLDRALHARAEDRSRRRCIHGHVAGCAGRTHRNHERQGEKNIRPIVP